MELSKFLACTLSVAVVVSAAACADGTGKPFTPTLPTTTNPASNPDGTVLKASSPAPATPANDSQLRNLRPTLTIVNAAGSQVDLNLTYTIELYEGDTLIQEITELTPAAPGRSSWQAPANLLKYGRQYQWRTRASHNNVNGPWSAMVRFSTPPPPPVDGPVECSGNSGPEIVRCVGRAYPSKLVATARGDGSLERRKANMEFIRDRVIETGRCKGLDLARNFKRGTPVISHDFIVWRTGGRTYGVDIATGYDDVSLPLRIKWQVFDDPPYGHPYYAGYPVPFDCNSLVPQP